MSRRIAVLRPEPGNRVTAAAIEAAARRALRLPLFEVRPVAWQAPESHAHDALVLTSANAVRHGGPGLAKLLALPVFAVGEATAAAARRAGFAIAGIGDAGSDALLAAARAAGVRRALHLAGRERRIEARGIVADVRTVYASEPRAIEPAALGALADAVALIHSPRAAARLASLIDAASVPREAVALAAISAAAADAAGPGWASLRVAARPEDAALLEAAFALAD